MIVGKFLDPMKIRRYIFFLVCILTVSVPNIAAESVAEYVEEGKAYLNHQPDSALYRFMLAYREGMSRDSLKYFWAETYITRGIYDSALILNHAIEWQDHKRVAVFNQRLKIYESLDWKQKAEVIRDSLGINRAFRLKFPKITIETNGSYTGVTEKQSYDYPFAYSSPNALSDTTIGGPAFGGFLTLQWEATKWLHLSGSAKMSKPYYSSFSIETDSSNIGLQAGFKLVNLFPGSSFRYLFEREWNSNSDFYNTNNVSLDYLFLLDRRVLFFNLAYTASFLQGRNLDYQYVSALAWFENAVNISKKLYGSFHAFFFIKEKMSEQIMFNGSEVWVTEVEIDNSMERPVTRITGPSYTTETVIPQSFANFNLTGGYSLNLPFGIGMRMRAGYTYNYYFEEYRWTEMKMNQESYAAYYYSAENGWLITGHDGEKVFIMHNSRVDADTLVYEGSYSRKNCTRSDKKLSLGASLSRQFAYLGDLQMKLQASRTWSSLKNGPIRIPKWEWSVGLSWKKSFDLSLISRRKEYL